MPARNHTINYIEFPAKDMAATKALFGPAFGWEFVDYGPRYCAFSGAGVDGGFTLDAQSVAAGEDGAQRGVLVVLYATDLEATESKLRSLGANVTRPIYAFPGGRRFHFLDPNGNELAVWSE